MNSTLHYWQLQSAPFRQANEPYRAAPLEEVLARITYLVDHRLTLGALIGESGMGKSTALAVAAEQLVQQRALVAACDALGASSRELFWQIACSLEAEPAITDSTSRLWQRLTDLAMEHVWQNQVAVILVDDAGHAGPDQCQQLIRLARYAANTGARWSFVFAATPAQADRWPELLREQVDLKMELRRWDDEVTVDYLQHALLTAGRLDPVFTEDALRYIHTLTHGVPRLINRLADLALMVGAESQASIIDAQMVEMAHQQTSLVSVGS